MEHNLEHTRWRRWIIEWMADVVDSASAIVIVRTFDVVTTHVLCLGADRLIGKRRSVGLVAELDLLQTAIMHVQGELHIVVDCVVYRFDSVRVVIRKFWIVGRLDHFVDDSVDYT